MKKSLVSLLLVSTIIFAGTYDDVYIPVGGQSSKVKDSFMYGDFKEIRRFDLIDKSGLDASDIGATDINHINTKHAKSDFNEVVKTIKNYVNSGEDIKVTVIGHASERTDIQEEVAVDSKTYANKIQNWFRPSQNSEQTLKKSSDFASDIAKKLKDNNISEDIIVVEYRGSQDLGFSTETDYGRDLSNRVMVAIYVIKPVGEKPVPVVAKVEEKDSDGDGVYDSKDECPDTPKGLMVDDVGCPITMTIRLNFEVDSYVIPESSKGKVVEFAEFLKKCSQQEERVVLIIDETHLLKVGPIEEIRLLANFKMDSLTRSH